MSELTWRDDIDNLLACCGEAQWVEETDERLTTLIQNLQARIADLEAKAYRAGVAAGKERQRAHDLQEQVAALESREVCTVAHDGDVTTCGYCQRDTYRRACEAAEEGVEIMEGIRVSSILKQLGQAQELIDCFKGSESKPGREL